MNAGHNDSAAAFWFCGKWDSSNDFRGAIFGFFPVTCLSTEGYPFGFQFAQLPCLLPTDFASNPVFPQLQSSKTHSGKNI
jgi:hypothetical protein